MEGYVGEILRVGVNYDKKTKIHECAIERIQKNDPLKSKNGPLKTKNDPLKNAKVTERRKQIEILVQTNIRISKEVLAEQLSISVSTIKREMKALGYEWVGHSANGYWRRKVCGNIIALPLHTICGFLLENENKLNENQLKKNRYGNK